MANIIDTKPASEPESRVATGATTSAGARRYLWTGYAVAALLVFAAAVVVAAWLIARAGLFGFGFGLIAAAIAAYCTVRGLQRATARQREATRRRSEGPEPESPAPPGVPGTAVPVRVWTGDDIRALGAVTTLGNAAQIFRLSQPAAHRLVKDDRFPVPVLRVGRGYRIPVAPILTALHLHLHHGATGSGAVDPGTAARGMTGVDASPQAAPPSLPSPDEEGGVEA